MYCFGMCMRVFLEPKQDSEALCKHAGAIRTHVLIPVSRWMPFHIDSEAALQ